MAVTLMCHDWEDSLSNFRTPAAVSAITELRRQDEPEVMEFLSVRPLHTVFMTGLIRDNGILSPQNRGSFYGSRNDLGQLDGVALIGHATLVEARTENALTCFAQVARNCQNTHLIRGEVSSIKTFWQYAGAGREPRQVCRELMFEMTKAPPAADDVPALRPATTNELDKLVAVNSALALEEAGTNPLQRDPSGFRKRIVRRIEKQRVWVWFEQNRLIFKADVVSATPAVTYLEGIYVHPEERGKGYGSRCLSKLCRQLLKDSRSLSLTVNHQNQRAAAFYTRSGFAHHSDYETIYLR